MSCKVETGSEEYEESENKRIFVLLALALGLVIVVGGSLDLFAEGVPLGFIIPILNETEIGRAHV